MRPNWKMNLFVKGGICSPNFSEWADLMPLDLWRYFGSDQRALDFGLGAFVPIAQWLNDVDSEAGTVTPITFLEGLLVFHLSIKLRCLYRWSADHGNLGSKFRFSDGCFSVCF